MNYKITPWAHQLKAIEAAKGRDCLALFFEQGCGKTSTLINILRHVYETEGIVSTLILCPSIVIENWVREFHAHSDIPHHHILPLTGPGWLRITKFKNQVEDANSPRIVITNYEILYNKVLLQKLTNWKPKVLALDESQKCKEPSSVRTKRCIDLSKTARYRYLLTGTPIVNSLFDIWSQFQILDHGKTFGTYWEFRNQYFIDENAGRPRQSYFPKWEPKMNAATDIGEKIAAKAIRAIKSECLDLPPLIKQVLHVEMSPEQEKAYQQMDADGVADWKGEQITADLAIKKALRLQQIVTGFMVDDDGQRICFDKNPRLDALGETIEQIGREHQVIIWAVFKQNYADIANYLRRAGYSYVEVHGEIPESKRQEAIDRFNRGDARFFVGNPSAAGIGLNLVGASYAIFYSRSFSLEADLQAEARNYRAGSERHEKVTRIDLVVPGTTDEIILNALYRKVSVQEAVLDYFQQQRKRTT